MPRLLLLRHADSPWAESNTIDRERPLSPIGVQEAEQMARQIARAEFLPDHVLCSPARRACETLAALEPYLASDCRIVFSEALYESEHDDYCAIIESYGDSPTCLLIVGHNPTIQATALGLIGSLDTTPAQNIADKFPPGALAVIDIPSRDWLDLKPGCGRLVTFIRPRDIERDQTTLEED
jgi:phosphohistidine phosphatase